MITQELPKRIAAQACPLCGTQQDVMINGTEANGQLTVVNQDAGYSFCNCRNIFFTNWSNINQAIYDEAYEERYAGDGVKECAKTYANAYFKLFKTFTSGLKFLEIGSASHYVLDEARHDGFETTGLDIIKHDFQHPMLQANFEEMPLGYIQKQDVIFASHIFEHFKDPLQAARKCHQLLNQNGILFVAMPDPYMIDWKDPYTWGHWHLKEHHILWDMDSFCSMMEEHGFKTVLKTRNTSLGFICVADYHLIFKKDQA